MPEWLEQVWLQRYLDRELNAEEEEWFEIHAIDKPHLVEAIENDNLLRDAVHAWHRYELRQAVGSSAAAPAGEPVLATAATTDRRRPAISSVLAMAASLVVAAGAGAGFAGWWQPSGGHADDAVSSPRRVLIDAQRGGTETTPLVESGSSEAPLLIDVAVPPLASDIVAHFGDNSSLPLTVSSDGFVSLLASRSTLQRLTPVRLVYRVDGHQVKRTLDLASTLESIKG